MIHTLKVKVQIPDSPNPEFVTDTYAEDKLVLQWPVNNYGSTIVMLTLGDSFALVSIDKLAELIRSTNHIRELGE